MKALERTLDRTQSWVWLFRHQPLTIRLLAVAAGLLTMATTFAAPAEADNPDDNFIDALNHAGIDFGEPGNAMSVGQEICPMLAKPGGSFATVASSVAGRGMSPRMAGLFTTIAIQTYCPEEMANIASGNLSAAMPPGMPGMAGQIPGMPGQIPGMPGQMPGMAGQIPGLTRQVPQGAGQLPGF